ncbi:MAG TPA: M23 family metallopeptidase, partial [Thermomicrobiales bacterium]|nr:M23 family metallopeptidase [Thermomicrobiales bacterium]
LFDYARFEYHPDLAPAGAAVQLGQLGREAMGALIYPPSPPFPTAPGREYVAATGHWLSYGFRDYWYAHDGIHLLGYPLSEEMAEGPRTVQYFERGRLEYDPAAPPGRAVTMTPLGAELLLRRGWPLPTRLSLTLSEPSPGQGMTTVAELRSDRAVTVTAARLDDQPVDFFGDPYDHRALVGVPPWAAVGMHRLTVTVRQDDGQVKTLGADVAVRETAFPRERLDLPPDESGLLDPAVSAREEQVVAPLYAIFTPERLWSGPFLMPVQGPITTEFGEMRAYNGGPFDSWHQGLDIGAPEGTPIRAAAAGRVVYAGHLDIRGNFVAIDDGLGVLTCYFHQSRIAVTVGQSVAAGDIIGYVGSTGLATGPHLHFEVRVAGTPVSPWQWMQGEVLK